MISQFNDVAFRSARWARFRGRTRCNLALFLVWGYRNLWLERVKFNGLTFGHMR